MLSKVLILSSILLSPLALARTDCEAGKVNQIQVEGNKILIHTEKLRWKNIGSLDDPATKIRFALALTAQTTQRPIMLSWKSDSWNCAPTEYSTPAYILRLYGK